MSDCEETDLLWESWGWTPGKEKRKKASKKDKRCLKPKNNITIKTDEHIQKKKKKKQFKEAIDGRKEKKKEKKKKRLALELDGNLIFTQGSGSQAKSTVKPETLNLHSYNKPTPDQDSKKKTKRKKKVAFDLSPGYICIKRPKCVSSSQQSPKESILLEKEAVRDNESCSQVTVTGHSQGQRHADESQCTNDSQDLFITQKTFSAPPPEPSSGEASDKAVTTSPQTLTPRDKLHTSMAWINEHLKGCPQDSDSYQHHRKTKEHVHKPKTVHVLLTEEEEEEEHPKKKSSFQTQRELNANLTGEKKTPCPAHVTPSVVTAHLDDPVDGNSPLDSVKSKKHYCSSCLSDDPSVLPPMSMESTSTQTENFFTTELSSYLNFYQKGRATVHLEDLKPLDLSLSHRARKDLGMCLSGTSLSLPGEIQGVNHKEPNLHPSFSSDMKNVKIKKDPSGRHTWSSSTQGKSATILSPKSESADTTTSSEDEPLCRTGKLDLTQVRAVQMRLNESFFFKTKGEGQSPRPESPLMKLAQGRQVKSKKGH
ncbi:uncharacterized protein LOC116686719 [Etheostoma spectabile]|uniref:uncharacterized protein LOC116686719 n=1 Tax=Etheostoma spectabile TaxID=54343 RepID=UPI0013AEB9B8|nr:uncharacterized protein LOC116686719 [Etheostoma spectabile]